MPSIQTSGVGSEERSRTALPEPRKGVAAAGPEPEPEPSGSAWRTWLVVLIVLLAVGAAVWKIHKNTAEQTTKADRMAEMGDRPVPVQVVTVQRKTMPIYLSALGTVTAYNTVTIKSRVDGQLMRVNVREGQAVHKGDPLMEIDPRPYEATVAQAEGQLLRDQAIQVNAAAEAKRYTALQEAGVVSKESQQLQVSTAGQAEGNVAADKATIQAAKVNLDYTKITSPIDGVVGLRQVDPGNIVHAADTTGLLVVTQLQPIAVIFTLPEDQLPQVLDLIRHGKRLVAEAYDRSGATHLATGALLTPDNQIDPTTGTDKLKAVFENRDGVLFPNQFVNIRLVLQDRRDATVLPAAAVETGVQGSYVYVVKPGQPPVGAGESRKTGAAGAGGRGQGGEEANQEAHEPPYYATTQVVEPDLTEAGQMIVKSGVEPGDQVVIDGQEKLKNYSRVIPHATPVAVPVGSRMAGQPSHGAGQANGATQPLPVIDTTRSKGPREQSLDERRRGSAKALPRTQP